MKYGGMSKFIHLLHLYKDCLESIPNLGEDQVYLDAISTSSCYTNKNVTTVYLILFLYNRF